MASGIIVILAALVPFFVHLLAARMTPAAEQKTLNEKLDKAVISGDTDTINAFLHDRVQPVSTEGGNNSGGQSGKI